MRVIQFLASPAGRWTRVIVGLVFVAAGVLLAGWWWLLAVLGLVFIAAGAFDFCLLAPLVGKPLNGAKLRESLNAE